MVIEDDRGCSWNHRRTRFLFGSHLAAIQGGLQGVGEGKMGGWLMVTCDEWIKLALADLLMSLHEESYRSCSDFRVLMDDLFSSELHERTEGHVLLSDLKLRCEGA